MKKSYIKPEVKTTALLLNKAYMITANNSYRNPDESGVYTQEEVDFDDDDNFWSE